MEPTTRNMVVAGALALVLLVIVLVLVVAALPA